LAKVSVGDDGGILLFSTLLDASSSFPKTENAFLKPGVAAE
jgi:hypothetical protein